MHRVLLSFLVLASMLSGCVGPDTANDPLEDEIPLPALPDAAPLVDAGALLADLGAFAPEFNVRASNVATHEGARQWMIEEFSSYGLEVYRQNFSTTSLAGQANIVGIKWGEVRDHWVVVGAHYDTMTDDCLTGSGTPVIGPAPSVDHGCPMRAGSQGAYDDGSGTMMTVHLAKAFSQLNTTYTMAFVGYDGEELGTQGARAFVNAFVTGFREENYTSQPYGKIKVVGAVDLDMIGLNWPGVMAPLNVIDNSDALWAEAKVKADELGFPKEQFVRKDGLQLGSSDYARFWEVTAEHGGPIPTIFLISDFEELGAPAPAPSNAYTPMGAYPFWHFFDTMETMTAMAGGADNLEAGFQSAVDVAAHVLWRLATDPAFEPDAVAK